MDLFNISAVELIVLVFLGGVVLGPRRLAKLGRDAGKVIRQIRALTGDLTKQLNLEIDLLEAVEGKPDQAAKSDGREAPLPEAYRRFRKDFPDEGQLDDLAAGSASGNRPSSQPQSLAATPAGEGQAKPADMSEPHASKTPQVRS